MKKLFLSSFGLPIFLSIFISIFYIPFASVSDANISYTNNLIFSNYAWPTRGYTTITSKFGYRKVPANGASTYHGGIDVGAPEGANICSIANGTVSFARLVWRKWIYCNYFA
ncbi:MAG: M23 family metallopeptidase [Clostridia bacterium]|nr:M23 family metallopeptidase [Clostridia bacterium]